MTRWYVEIKKEVVRFGYVDAETRDDAVKLLRDDQHMGEQDGLWEVVEVHEYTGLGQPENLVRER